MSHYFVPWFGAALLVAIILTPILGKIAIALGVVDHPSQRKFHLTSMPLMGGLSITITFVTLSLLVLKSQMDFKFAALIMAGFVMMVLGLIDDIKAVSPSVKLVGQVAITTLLVMSGLRVYLTGIEIIDYPLTFLWVVGITNCLNLLDNIDGLSAGAAAIASCFLFVAALYLGEPLLAVLCVIFSGACLGFLFHNFHPAAIFSGDAGSLFMGTMLAGFGLFIMQPHDLISHMVPPVIMGLLIFDTGLVSSLRIMNGFGITDGGKDHTSHRLCNIGLGVQSAVSTLLGICFLFGLSGVLMLRLDKTKALVVPAVLILFMVAGWFYLRQFYDYSKHNPRKGKPVAP